LSGATVAVLSLTVEFVSVRLSLLSFVWAIRMPPPPPSPSDRGTVTVLSLTLQPLRITDTVLYIPPPPWLNAAPAFVVSTVFPTTSTLLSTSGPGPAAAIPPPLPPVVVVSPPVIVRFWSLTAAALPNTTMTRLWF
jgi:hypothetical protein